MPIEHLPSRVQPTARRVRAFLMTDSTALLLLAAVQVAVGFYYLPGTFGDPLQWQRPAEMIMPITAWAWVHIGIGALCGAAAFTDRGHIDVVALAAATGLNLSWTFSLLAAAVEYDQAVLWLVGVLILAMTFSLMWAVWRGKRGDIPFAKEGGAA
ncbi:hypothetical protein ACQX25_09645 [Corynebacterium diphtheriae]|uniref:hypothetical protein n=3 Tax=Corynebacterium diphtheriae TaxID=1717 RepID=UPI0008694788|nr:hypothetical protein [Corynebacterium diphtheriae]AWR14911.1 hypothetical protein B11Q_00193 [Corynebacterium diphtheriae]MBG9313444.1 hypothetical protein [Corynebacterium diphtheriae bv. mitis]ODS19338.1 hypothetical protein BGK43_11020 [Corynebacterium diphtheriae]ODS21083.1 hypothetical protein BGK40_09505 [Corynebacterium diphtheriae]OIR83363.1 hypothetical protein BHF85_10775 [Corynebacterium diphtheriae]